MNLNSYIWSQIPRTCLFVQGVFSRAMEKSNRVIALSWRQSQKQTHKRFFRNTLHWVVLNSIRKCFAFQALLKAKSSKSKNIIRSWFAAMKLQWRKLCKKQRLRLINSSNLENPSSRNMQKSLRLKIWSN